jgi:hypothetical protein
MAKTSSTLVIAEGGFCKEQFPKSAAEERSQGEFEALVAVRVAEAASETEQRVGATHYAATDADVVQILTTAETYLAAGKTYNTMLNVIGAWDAEALPSEFVESDTCAAQRDWYFAQWQVLTGQFAVLPLLAGGMPRLITAGCSITAEAN